MHILTVGNSLTGKSNLNKAFAENCVLKGEAVVVYDPLKAVAWPESAIKFASPELFLKYIMKATEAHVFIDEAKTLWDYDYKRADKLLYNGRHRGLLVYLIAQRTRMVPPNARNQCSMIFAFKQQKDDADTLSSEYHESMALTKSLKQGEFCYTDGFNFSRGEMDYANGVPPRYKIIHP